MNTFLAISDKYANQILLLMSGVLHVIEFPVPFDILIKWFVGLPKTEITITPTFNSDTAKRYKLDWKENYSIEIGIIKLQNNYSGLSIIGSKDISASSSMMDVGISLEENIYREKFVGFLLKVFLLAINDLPAIEEIPSPQDIRLRGKPGRKHYEEDITAWKQVNEEHKPIHEVYKYWIENNGRETALIDPKRQFNRIINPNWYKAH